MKSHNKPRPAESGWRAQCRWAGSDASAVAGEWPLPLGNGGYAFPVQLAYDDGGSGECVVLIHGHPFDRTLWEPQLAGLRGSFRVLAPDLRGFGRSPVTPGRVLM